GEDGDDRARRRQVTMKLIRFQVEGERPKLGAVKGGRVFDLSERYGSLGELLASDSPIAQISKELEEAVSGSAPSFEAAGLLEEGSAVAGGRKVRLLAPVDEQEVWASGVTYKRSEEARKAESKGAAQFYALVYDADRP